MERVVIEIGPLAGVEPALLAQAFRFARAGSCAAQAVLSIETTEVTVRCLRCGVESQTPANRLVCAVCGGYRTQIIAGDELRLRRVELQVPQPVSAA